MVGGIVCIAAANAGATSQDLKTGFLVGATPIRQQIGLLIGVMVSVVVIGGTVLLLDKSVPGELHGIGSARMPAPQGTLMATIIRGMLAQKLPWGPVLGGCLRCVHRAARGGQCALAGRGRVLARRHHRADLGGWPQCARWADRSLRERKGQGGEEGEVGPGNALCDGARRGRVARHGIAIALLLGFGGSVAATGWNVGARYVKRLGPWGDIMATLRDVRAPVGDTASASAGEERPAGRPQVGGCSDALELRMALSPRSPVRRCVGLLRTGRTKTLPSPILCRSGRFARGRRAPDARAARSPRSRGGAWG